MTNALRQFLVFDEIREHLQDTVTLCQFTRWIRALRGQQEVVQALPLLLDTASSHRHNTN